jgi:BirA family biotin operon repressor/biotin-[acetyl-CoA-carboxylase] ligase
MLLSFLGGESMFVCSKSYTKELQAALAGETVAVSAYGELDSTNTEAKRLAARGVTDPAVVAAESQTAGRGRMGRSFFSPHGTGAYFSFLYTPQKPLADAVSVTSAAAVAVMRAVRELTGLQCGIKWVNDLYLDGKKVCGILCESVSVNDKPQIIVGIGINLCTAEFPCELSDKAGALGVSVDRCELIAAVWRELCPFLHDPSDRAWLEDYRKHSCVLGKRVAWSQGNCRCEGVAEAISPDGGICVRRADGVLETLRTGEISLFVDGINL